MKCAFDADYNTSWCVFTQQEIFQQNLLILGIFVGMILLIGLIFLMPERWFH